eukprot:scaffold284598_cov26-Tisochrysis_lutea.AAC.1
MKKSESGCAARGHGGWRDVPGVFAGKNAVRTTWAVKVAAASHIDDATLECEQQRLVWVGAVVLQ